MTLKNIFLGAAILLSYTQLFAQNCVRLISTRYDSSYNNVLSPYYPNKVNPWLNTFNFAEYIGPTFSPIQLNTTAGWAGYTGGTLSMVSPFSPSMGSGYEYLWGPTGNAPYQQDIHWEDGWEMMWLNTGYYPNGELVNVGNPNRITQVGHPLANPRTPYMVLYNRFTGKLRMFANIYADLNAYDSARLTLVQSSITKSGVFRHTLNYDPTLDEPTEATQISSANILNNNNSTLWWSTDFQLSYDPCVCKHPSSFEVQISAASTLDVDLFGRSVSLVQNIGAYNSSYLSNETIRDAANSGEGGSLLFKSIGGMIDNYNNQMDLYNTRMKSYNAPMNQGLRLVLGAAKDGVANAGGAFVNKAIGGLALRTLIMIDGPSKKDTATSNEWAEQASKAAKGALAKEFDNLLLPNLSVDFFKEPIKPTMPTATFSEMRIAGKITDEFSVKVSNLLTPGSYKLGQTLTPYNYPSYDNAVGLFALLRKPQVLKLYDTSRYHAPDVFDIVAIDTSVLQDDSLERISNIVERGRQTWTHGHQVNLRFKDPLKYKFNRALDFDDDNTNLYVSFVVEMDNAVFDSTVCFDFNPVSTGNMYLRDAFPPQDGKPYQAIFESTWKNMKDVGEEMFTVDFTNTFNTFLDRDVLIVEKKPQLFTTITYKEWKEVCFNEIEAMFNVKRVKMKIAADMYFDQIGSNGLQNNTFQSFTYLLYDRETGVDILNSTQDSTVLLHYKQPHLVLTNETIETTDPFVMETKGTVIYVNAKTIELHGNIDVQTGYTAVLQATKNIKLVSGNTNVSNKVKFKTVNGFSRFDNITETTQSELDAFCQDQNNGYKALVAASKTEDEAEEPKEEAAKKIATNVYPNPAANQINIAIGANEEKQYTFQVFDLVGRSLINETIVGANQPQFEINTELLSNGTYLLRINSADGVVAETHRIVILK